MNKAIYNTEIGRLMVLLLPCILRRARMASLTDALSQPFKELLVRAQAIYDDTEHRTLYNGQVCRLQMLLNDKLDPDMRGIRVTDGDLITGAAYILYKRGADRGRSDAMKARGASVQVMLPTRAASMKTKYDFTVAVPRRVLPEADHQTKERNMRKLTALVNTYKLPSTKWNVAATQ